MFFKIEYDYNLHRWDVEIDKNGTNFKFWILSTAGYANTVLERLVYVGY